MHPFSSTLTITVVSSLQNMDLHAKCTVYGDHTIYLKSEKGQILQLLPRHLSHTINLHTGQLFLANISLWCWQFSLVIYLSCISTFDRWLCKVIHVRYPKEGITQNSKWQPFNQMLTIYILWAKTEKLLPIIVWLGHKKNTIEENWIIK